MEKLTGSKMGGVNLQRFVLKAFGTYIAATLVCVVLVAPFVDFAASWLGLIAHNLPIFLLSLIACTALAVLYSFLQDISARANFLKRKRFFALSLCMGLLLFVTQLYLQKSAGFVCGWDVGNITPSWRAGPEQHVCTRTVSFDLSEPTVLVRPLSQAGKDRLTHRRVGIPHAGLLQLPVRDNLDRSDDHHLPSSLR